MKRIGTLLLTCVLCAVACLAGEEFGARLTWSIDEQTMVWPDWWGDSHTIYLGLCIEPAEDVEADVYWRQFHLALDFDPPEKISKDFCWLPENPFGAEYCTGCIVPHWAPEYPDWRWLVTGGVSQGATYPSQPCRARAERSVLIIPLELERPDELPCTYSVEFDWIACCIWNPDESPMWTDPPSHLVGWSVTWVKADDPQATTEEAAPMPELARP